MSRVVVTLTLLLTAAAAAILVDGASPPHDDRGAEFQRLVGGLGLGPAPDASRCESAFDRKLTEHRFKVCEDDSHTVLAIRDNLSR